MSTVSDCRIFSTLFLAMLLSSQTHAAGHAAGMEALDDVMLSGISAADGIEISAGSTGSVTVSQMKWVTDGNTAAGTQFNCTGGVTNRHACTLINNVAITGVSTPLKVTSQFDVGAASLTGAPGVNLNIAWDPLKLVIGGPTISTPTNPGYAANSFGSTAILSTGSLQLAGLGGNGLLSSGGNTSYFNLTSLGDVIYRQGGPGSAELSFGNFSLGGRFTNGAAAGQGVGFGNFGVTNEGLVINAPFGVLDLFFDLMFKANPVDFDTTGREAMILFGWQGGLKNIDIRVKPGGIGYGTYASTTNHPSGISYTYLDANGAGGTPVSEGLRINAQWDFDTDTKWIIGQAGGNRTQIHLYDYVSMGSSPSPQFRFPLAFDVLQNGIGPGGVAGSSGLCWGGGFTAGTPNAAGCGAQGGTFIATGPAAGESAVAVMMRDAWVHAYSTKIDVRDPVASFNSTFNWSILYTFGKLDLDVFLSPEGPAAATVGARTDVTLTIQSPGFWAAANSPIKATRDAAGANWATNTHFLLADTGVTTGPGCSVAAPCRYGVGLLNADLLWDVRDMYIRVMPNGAGTATPNIPGGLWLQASSGARYHFRGLLGGGNLANLARSQLSQAFLLDLNLDTSNFLFALSPGTVVGGDAPIRFDGLLDFNSNAYLKISEVSSPAASFRINNISGRIGWQNGQILVQSGATTPDGLPRLVISNDLLFGTSASFGGAAGAPLVASDVGFGGETFGKIALPAGQWHSSIALKIPL